MTLPCVCALLPNKLEAINEHLLTKLCETEPEMNAVIVITDFEKAAMNAFTSKFQFELHGSSIWSAYLA